MSTFLTILQVFHISLKKRLCWLSNYLIIAIFETGKIFKKPVLYISKLRAIVYVNENN